MDTITAHGIVFCLCILPALSQDPKITFTVTEPEIGKDNTIKAVRDRDVTLSCYVENLPLGTQVRWLRLYLDDTGKEQTEPISTDQAVEDNTRYGIEKPTMFTWRLRIRNIPLAYSGIYQCYVQLVLQTKLKQEVKVVVFVPPVLDPAQTSSDMTVKAGDTVDLLCNASGVPPPTIEWRRQGKALLPMGQEIYRGSKMTITNIQAKHRGIYKCKAANEIATVNRDIEVKVKFKAIIVVYERYLHQALGYVIELQCLIEANPEPSNDQLSWFRGPTGISQSSGRYNIKIIRGAFNKILYELSIDGVTEEDYGDYRCQAITDLGTSYGEVRLSKSDEPRKSVKFGMVIASACNVKLSVITFITALLFAFCLQR